LGCGHVGGTLMRQDLVALLRAKKPAAVNHELFTRVDHEREFHITPLEPFTYETKLSSEHARLLLGRDPAQGASAQAVFDGSKARLKVMDAAGETVFPVELPNGWDRLNPQSRAFKIVKKHLASQLSPGETLSADGSMTNGARKLSVTLTRNPAFAPGREQSFSFKIHSDGTTVDLWLKRR
ncbi:MAG TPA: hypothetical protein VFV50_03665, partial [Bdellovibrionales bacterium]|nr:hypothetical protein [Bdellovibrionales bacterium]